LKYTGQQLKTARENAGHTQIKAAVIISVSTGTIVDLETKEKPPKSLHIQKAINIYIQKHLTK